MKEKQMEVINSILLNLVANTIGLVIPKWFNTLYGKELFEDKPSNWFYGSFALTLTALLICQYTDSTTIRFIANVIAGGNAYITALCFNMILKQNEEITLTNSHNEEEDNKHNNSPKVVIRLINVIKITKAKKKPSPRIAAKARRKQCGSRSGELQ